VDSPPRDPDIYLPGIRYDHKENHYPIGLGPLLVPPERLPVQLFTKTPFPELEWER
jgi:hypothetical protein